MQIPLKAGRYFDARDTATSERSVIINEDLAKALWPGQEAVGQMLSQAGGTRVIGVVVNVRHGSLDRAGGNEMYLHYRQTGDWGGMEMVVRSSRPMESRAPEVRAALAAHDPTLPNGDYYPLDRLIENAVAPRRLTTQLLSFFSALALVLAAIGLYGVIAYSVTQRTHEIGIRLAIGAQRRDVLRLILAGGMELVAIGVVCGLTASFFMTRALDSLLFGVTARDPIVFAANAGLVVALALAACVLPAIRATRVNPIIALRAD
jgi:hypothetical protein